MAKPLWKIIWQFHLIIKLDLSYDLAIKLLRAYSHAKKLYTDVFCSLLCSSQKL